MAVTESVHSGLLLWSFGEDCSMTLNLTMSNLLSTNVVMSIPVSVHSHEHSLRVDYITVHTILKQKFPNGPFSHSRPQIKTSLCE